jgi:hypothetical protein
VLTAVTATTLANAEPTTGQGSPRHLDTTPQRPAPPCNSFATGAAATAPPIAAAQPAVARRTTCGGCALRPPQPLSATAFAPLTDNVSAAILSLLASMTALGIFPIFAPLATPWHPPVNLAPQLTWSISRDPASNRHHSSDSRQVLLTPVICRILAARSKVLFQRLGHHIRSRPRASARRYGVGHPQGGKSHPGPLLGEIPFSNLPQTPKRKRVALYPPPREMPPISTLPLIVASAAPASSGSNGTSPTFSSLCE